MGLGKVEEIEEIREVRIFILPKLPNLPNFFGASGRKALTTPHQKLYFRSGFATLGGFGGDGLYLAYYPLQTKTVAAAKTLPSPTQKLILEVALPRSAKK